MIDSDTGTQSTEVSDISRPLTDYEAAGAFERILDDGPDKDKPEQEAQARAQEPVADPDQEPEAEVDEPEANADEEEEDTAEEQDKEQPENPKEIDLSQEVTLPSGEKVTLEELQKGYLRQDDYTRKSMRRAEAEKAVEAERQQVKAYYQSVEQEAQQIAGVLQDALRTLNELDQYAAKELYAKVQQADLQIKQARQQRSEQERQMQQLHLQRVKTDNISTMQALAPELFTQKGWESFQSNAVSAMQAVGYSREEVHGILSQASQGTLDPRMVAMLSLAAKQQALQANRPKVEAKTKAAKPMRSSKRRSANDDAAQRYAQKMERAKRTGRDDDVAAALMEIID